VPNETLIGFAIKSLIDSVMTLLFLINVRGITTFSEGWTITFSASPVKTSVPDALAIAPGSILILF
jgi:hypothetical protein